MVILPTDWTRYDYLALTLLYAAQADQHFHPAEHKHLIKLCGKKHYAHALAFIQQHSPEQIIEAITQGKAQFYPGAGGTQALDYQLRALFQADEDFSQIEKDTLHTLQQYWQ